MELTPMQVAIVHEALLDAQAKFRVELPKLGTSDSDVNVLKMSVIDEEIAELLRLFPLPVIERVRRDT